MSQEADGRSLRLVADCSRASRFRSERQSPGPASRPTPRTLAVPPNYSIRHGIGPLGYRVSRLTDRHRDAVGKGSLRANQQAWLPANATPHNAHASPCEPFPAATVPRIDQKHGPRRKPLEHSPTAVRTLSLRGYQLERSPFRDGRGIFVSEVTVRNG